MPIFYLDQNNNFVTPNESKLVNEGVIAAHYDNEGTQISITQVGLAGPDGKMMAVPYNGDLVSSLPVKDSINVPIINGSFQLDDAAIATLRKEAAIVKKERIKKLRGLPEIEYINKGDKLLLCTSYVKDGEIKTGTFEIRENYKDKVLRVEKVDGKPVLMERSFLTGSKAGDKGYNASTMELFIPVEPYYNYPWRTHGQYIPVGDYGAYYYPHHECDPARYGQKYVINYPYFDGEGASDLIHSLNSGNKHNLNAKIMPEIGAAHQASTNNIAAPTIHFLDKKGGPSIPR